MDKPNEIPEEFYSDETGKPFEKCADCERSLLMNDIEYSVSKIHRQYEGYSAKDVILEFAMCTDCAEKLLEGISNDSMETIMAYQLKIMLSADEEFDKAMRKCIFSGKTRESLKTYQVIGFFKGTKLSEESFPYLIDNEELEKLNDELSEATKDFFDDFYQDLIGPMPEWFTDDVPGGKPVLI